MKSQRSTSLAIVPVAEQADAPATSLPDACARGYYEVIPFLRNKLQPFYLDATDDELQLLRRIEKAIGLMDAPRFFLGTLGRKQQEDPNAR